jgi:hypothetical protein
MARFSPSSTYEDLVDFRAELYHTQRRMGHEAIAMEDYVAADVRPVRRCLDDVKRCAVYIGIIAWRSCSARPRRGRGSGEAVSASPSPRSMLCDEPRISANCAGPRFCCQ